MNNKTLIRGESLSINVKLDYDGIPFSEIDHGEIIANAWFQNNFRVPLIVTQLEGDGEYNLYSDVDTRKLRGESFLVNVIVKNLEGDAPEDLIMATFNQTFYIVNSATDMDNRPLPVGGGHSVVYLVDGEYYACESYPDGATITPVAAPTREGYTFSGWSGIPQTMPDHCIVVYGEFEAIHGAILDTGFLGLNNTAPFTIYEDGWMIVSGTGYIELFLRQESPDYFYTVKHVEIKEGILGVRHNNTYNTVPFDACEFKSISIPNSCSEIGEFAFCGINFSGDWSSEETYDPTPYLDIVLPRSSINIGNSAFYNSIMIRSITYGERTRSIGSGQWAGTSVSRIVIPDSVKTLGSQVMDSDHNLLEEIDFGSGIESLGYLYFGNLPSLKRIYFRFSGDISNQIAWNNNIYTNSEAAKLDVYYKNDGSWDSYISNHSNLVRLNWIPIGD